MRLRWQVAVLACAALAGIAGGIVAGLLLWMLRPF